MTSIGKPTASRSRPRHLWVKTSSTKEVSDEQTRSRNASLIRFDSGCVYNRGAKSSRYRTCQTYATSVIVAAEGPGLNGRPADEDLD